MRENQTAAEAWQLYAMRRSQATQALESGDAEAAKRFTRLAARHKRRSEYLEYCEARWGVFAGMPATILEPGDKGW